MYVESHVITWGYYLLYLQRTLQRGSQNQLQILGIGAKVHNRQKTNIHIFDFSISRML